MRSTIDCTSNCDRWASAIALISLRFDLILTWIKTTGQRDGRNTLTAMHVSKRHSAGSSPWGDDMLTRGSCRPLYPGLTSRTTRGPDRTGPDRTAICINISWAARPARGLTRPVDTDWPRLTSEWPVLSASDRCPPARPAGDYSHVIMTSHAHASSTAAAAALSPVWRSHQWRFMSEQREPLPVWARQKHRAFKGVYRRQQNWTELNCRLYPFSSVQLSLVDFVRSVRALTF